MDPMSEVSEQHQPAWKSWSARLSGGSVTRSLQPASTRRALLLTALGGLLIAGLTTALPAGADDHALIGYLNEKPVPSLSGHGNQTFSKAREGDCLDWPDRAPDKAKIVDCTGDHRFEVAESVDMNTFPGSEYGPNAAPPSEARIKQISQEQCQAAVRRYLGTRYDPNSRFMIGMLWSGDRAWKQSDRRMLCGLQLPGADNVQLAFKGKVADLDQSKVWDAGTCLGIEASTNQPTDVPIDCNGPHAMEVTGTVNLAEKFPAALPSEQDQDTFLKDVCTKMTEAYLAPVQLRTTTLTLTYSTLSLPSWAAGSRQISCHIGATLGNGGWATLVGSAKGPLMINGRPPVPPPDIPDERLLLPPIPLTTDLGTPVVVQSPSTARSTPTQRAPSSSSATPSSTPPPSGTTFIGSPPPSPGAPPPGPPPGEVPPPGAPAPAPGPPPPAPVEPAPPPAAPPPAPAAEPPPAPAPGPPPPPPPP